MTTPEWTLTKAKAIVDRQCDALTKLAWADTIPPHIRDLMIKEHAAALAAAYRAGKQDKLL